MHHLKELVFRRLCRLLAVSVPALHDSIKAVLSSSNALPGLHRVHERAADVCSSAGLLQRLGLLGRGAVACQAIRTVCNLYTHSRAFRRAWG